LSFTGPYSAGAQILTDGVVELELLQPERRIDWVPGVPAGIPDVAALHSVLDFGAVGDGVTDDASAFQAALDAIPNSGGAVIVPAGTYLLLDTISLGDGAVLRGEGPDLSRLHCDLGGSSQNCFKMETFERGDWVDVIGGLEKGSTTLTVTDPSGFTAPTYAEIQEDNDPVLMYTDPLWEQDWSEESVGEFLEIVAVSGDQLLLAEPLHISYRAELNPTVRTQGLVEGAGIEELYIERLDAGDGHTIHMKNTAHTWVRGVESNMTFRSHVNAESTLGCEVRDSYLHHSHDYGGGGHGYGVNLGRHATSCLVENNVFYTLRHAMLVQVGANGNVFGYNYSTETLNESGGTMPDISVHGHYPFFNLFEGNILEEVGLTDWWGPAGPGNTLLRNCITHRRLRIHDASHDQNLLGNALTAIPPNALEIDADITGTLVHGHLEDGVEIWDPEHATRRITSSLYLTERPGFFPPNATWPSTGNDVTDCTNPALERWQRGDPIETRLR